MNLVTVLAAVLFLCAGCYMPSEPLGPPPEWEATPIVPTLRPPESEGCTINAEGKTCFCMDAWSRKQMCHDEAQSFQVGNFRA